jgi:hypothetical protein
LNSQKYHEDNIVKTLFNDNEVLSVKVGKKHRGLKKTNTSDKLGELIIR